jgi:hypothetical protein
LLAAQNHVVDTQHPRATLTTVILERMQDPQECIRADAPPSPPACRAKVVSSSVVPVRPTSVVGQLTIEAFSEDLARAGRRIAEPAKAVHAHPHGLAAPGEIERVPIVASVLPTAEFTAPRTRDGHPRGFDDQNDAPAFGLCPN